MPAHPLGNPALSDQLQARIAARLLRELDRDELPPGVAERLRVAREQAVALKRRSASAAIFVGGGGANVLAATPSWWTKVGSVLPILLLVGGLFLIEHWNRQGQIHAAADIDAAILVDELPPAAYSDPGFAEFLKSPRP